jgi:hypothetical protein
MRVLLRAEGLISSSVVWGIGRISHSSRIVRQGLGGIAVLVQIREVVG